uniref:Uncharacterized protein n=1 Tax=Pantoea phage Survivor TaxID=3232176 RepID=A0AAU8KY89_9CAUD
MKAIHYLVQTVRVLICLLFILYVTVDLYFDYLPWLVDTIEGYRQPIWMLVFLEAGFSFGKGYQSWRCRKLCRHFCPKCDPKRTNFDKIQSGARNK